MSRLLGSLLEWPGLAKSREEEDEEDKEEEEEGEEEEEEVENEEDRCNIKALRVIFLL